MDSQTIREALGRLQADPDAEEQWEELRQAVTVKPADLSNDELAHLLDAARDEHAARGEWDAVRRLLEVALMALEAEGDAVRQGGLLRELARVQSVELLDDEAASTTYKKLQGLGQGSSDVDAALADIDDKRARHAELIKGYIGEVESAPDDVYKSSMLMRASEMELRFAGEGSDLGTVIERLEQAVRLDPSNLTASKILERVYRREQRWDEAARVLERVADRSEDAESRVAAGIRLARLYLAKLDDKSRASRAYDRVLRTQANHPEAMSFLSEFYSAEERWDDLVQLYENELNAKSQEGDVVGEMFQIAMLHWKKRDNPASAEPWFDKILKLDAVHEGALNFFREYCQTLDDDARLFDILQAAQREAKNKKQKAALGKEVAKLAEGQENAQKAIEQYKSVLRQDPESAEARAGLKRLYKQTQGYNALVELLRQELERTPQDAHETRLAILREVAAVYRQYIKSETALVAVLNQIVQLDDKLDERDILEIRELVGLYEKLGRWRDLLTNQQRLAEWTEDVEEKKSLYRAVARRWLDQFSNIQNATEAYAALLAIQPDDTEARERLEELYRKRRAWPQLYELYEVELERAEGAARLPLMREMATLAAERLNRPSDAIALFKKILEEDGARLDILAALEKHAERAKDWESVADALERRAELTEDVAGKLAILQKLGAVCADHLGDGARATAAWREVLRLQPGHHRALRVLRDTFLQDRDYDGLEQLYASQNDFEGLADVLSTAADRSKQDSEKVDLSYRAARVYEKELEQPDRAFRSYERVLTVAPNDARAAAALIPLYEQDEKWARLPALYEVLLSHATDESEKVDILSKLAGIAGTKLSDKKAATQYARQAYLESPRSREALALLEQTSAASGTWEGFVQALEERLASIPPPPPEGASVPPPARPEPTGKRRRGKRKKKSEAQSAAAPAPAGQSALSDDERRNLGLRLADVYFKELGKSDEAVLTLKKLVESRPEDGEAAAALEEILRSEDRRDDLRWLLDLRVQRASSDAARVELLTEWATLEEEAFEAPEAAAELHRRTLELAPTDVKTLSALSRILLATGDAAGAVKVIEQHRDAVQGEDRALREVELSELYLRQLARPKDALEACTRALEAEVERARIISVLESLSEAPETKQQAAELLADLYAGAGDARRETQALELMLKESKDPAERLSLYQRLATVLEQKLGSQSSALDVTLRALGEFPQEIALWDYAEALSTAAGRPTDLAERFRETMRTSMDRELEVELSSRAARLHEDKLGDPMGAAPYLQKMLELDASNEVAFQHLKDILTAAESWSELEALYDRASQATDDTSRRIDMLIEVALICEEIIEDATKAARYYERILELEPTHDVGLKALDRLYQRLDEKEKLAELLTRRLELAVGDELLELKIRLSRLEIELHRPERAIDHVEDVLGERLNDYEARELGEKLLEIGNLRVRAARMLEAVYEARDEVRDLVRVLGIRLDGVARADSEGDADASAERCELLRRISLLRDDRLHDDEGALEALAELAPLDPVDADTRARLLEVGHRLRAHARVAEVLSSAAQRADTPGLKGEILSKVAQLYEQNLDDLERAEATYRRVLDLDENDIDLVLPAAKSLERIYAGSGRPAELAEMLRVQVRLESDSEARAELLGRLGELCQSELGDLDGAIAAFSSRVDDNPDDGVALKALDDLYERAGRWRELVAILERRRDRTEEAEDRKAIMLRMAEVQWHKLEALAGAVESYQAVVDEFGVAESTLTALENLYAATERWDELNDVIDGHLDVSEEREPRLGLLVRQGNIRQEHLGDFEGAIDCYRRALTIEPTHDESRAALQGLLTSDDSITRRDAAAILGPIYEAENASEQLLKVLEIQAEAAEDPEAKLASLTRAREVAEDNLGDAQRAYDYAARSVREARGHTALSPYLDHLERLANTTSRQAEQVKLLSEVIPDIFDGDVQFAVTLKVANLARHHLADAGLATEYYKKALELRVDDSDALVALESLYDEAGDATSLLDILERRADIAETDADRKQLLFRRGRLLADVIKDSDRAIQVYESILDNELDEGALGELEKLYETEERWVELVALYQRQLDEGYGAEADLHVKIAQTASTHQGDFDRAFEEFEAALEVDRQHAPAVSGLEELMSSAKDLELRARAASLLEPVYLLRADYPSVMEAIRARLKFSQDPSDRRELLGRLAKLYEEQQEDYVAALETTAQLLEDDLGDQGTNSELERLAKVAGAEQRLAEIYAERLEALGGDDDTSFSLCRRTAELFAQLGENDRALAFYRRALAFEPESRSLFEAVDTILKSTQQHEERVRLYRDALEHRFESSDRLATLHAIAQLQQGQLGDPDQAIDTYRAALEVDEMDAATQDALSELYASRGRTEDLAAHLQRRAEIARDTSEATRHRLALAKLYSQALSRPEQALDQLEEVVREDPANKEAVQALEALKEQPELRERIVDILRPLYEAADDWKNQIKLNEDRFQLALDDLGRSVVLRETAELWENRGDDPDKARQAYREALGLEPDDSETRANYERLAEATTAWDELTALYEGILASDQAPADKREFLATLARVHDKRRDDPRQALEAYSRLHDLDPMDTEAIMRMERLATLLSDWPVLVKVLTAKAEISLDDEERASIWRRVGEAKRDMLEDQGGAIDAYEKALEIEESNAFTLDCLIDLYEGTNEPERLAEIYQQRVELCDEADDELKHQLLVQSSALFEEKLKDPPRAIESLRAALEVRSVDAEVRQRLNRLYAAEGLWSDLLDNLRAQEHAAESRDERASIRGRMGEVLYEQLSSYDEALSVYSGMLEDDPADSVATRAAIRLGDEHEEMRISVADVLIPKLRQTENYAALVDILEMRLSAETDPSDRRATLGAKAEVYERNLDKADEALKTLLRALSERPDDAELHDEIERLAQATDGWSHYAAALEERAQASFDPDLVKDLSVRAGQVFERRTSQVPQAIAAYERAVEQVGDQSELLEALDRLYVLGDDTTKLGEVLNRRVLVEDDNDVQADLQFRLGQLHAEKLNDYGQALGFLRGALERRQDHDDAVLALEKLTEHRDLFEEAAEVLEEVFRGRGQTDRLATLYEKRIGFADSEGERADMRRNLAQVLEHDCSDPAAAQKVLQQGLAETPTDGALLEEVERLAPITGDWGSAATAFAEGLESAADLPQETLAEAYQRLAEWQRDKLGSPAEAERALERALDHGPHSDQLLESIQALQREPGRERDLVVTLRRRARLAVDDGQREEFYRLAKELADGLGDAPLAEELLRELIGRDDVNLWALGELTRVAEEKKNFQETFDLLVKRSELRAAADVVHTLRHRAATLAHQELRKPEEAVRLYETLFEDDPQDHEAATALRELYPTLERHDELCRLLERLVDLTDDTEERSRLRLELATLSEEQLNDTSAAVEFLRQVLDDQPGQEQAVVFLSRLYEKEERDEDLAALLSTQIAAAEERGEIDSVLAFQVRLGEIYDGRLQDRAKAITAYREVLERDHQHRAALEALARLYEGEGAKRELIEVLARLVALENGEAAVALALRLAAAHAAVDDRAGEVSALERGLQEVETHEELRQRLQSLYESEGMWEKLAGLLARGAEIADAPGEKVRLLRQAADIHSQKLSDQARAAELLKSASDHMPADRELLLQLCDAYSASGRGQEAALVLQKIVESYGGKRSKELGEIHRRLADAYLAQGDSQGALAELDRAFRIEPGNVNVLKKLGEVALDAGELKKAQQMFRALLLQRLDANSPITKAEVFMNLGRVHSKLGEHPKAIQMLERAIQTDANLEAAKELLAELKG